MFRLNFRKAEQDDEDSKEMTDTKNRDESKRAAARDIAHRHLSTGDALGWFEELYSQAQGDPSVIPWADLAPNPNLVEWLNTHGVRVKENLR
jgi:hypothetical protein